MTNFGFRFPASATTAKSIQAATAAGQEVNKSNEEKLQTVENNLNFILKNSDQSLTTDKVVLIGKKLLNIAASASGITGLGTAVDLVYDAAVGSKKPVVLKMNDMTTNQHLMSGSLDTFTDLAKDFTQTLNTLLNNPKGEQTSIYNQKKKLISSIKSRFSNIKLEPLLQKKLDNALVKFAKSLNDMMDNKFGENSSLLKDMQKSDDKGYDESTRNALKIKPLDTVYSPFHLPGR